MPSPTTGLKVAEWVIHDVYRRPLSAIEVPLQVWRSGQGGECI